MPAECSAPQFDFGVVEARRVVAAFDGGAVTSDAGALLLAAADKAIRLIERFASCFSDGRSQERIEHEITTLVGQRVFGLALGYEDVLDHDQLRHDPAMAVLAGKLEARRQNCAPLAGKSTLNRLEHAPAGGPTRYHKIGHDAAAIERLFIDLFLDANPKPPAQIILDLDATDDPLHGHQEGRFFHGYYDCWCYLPLYVFCGRHLLAAKLRRSNIDASAGAVEEVERIVQQIRRRWPRVKILLRADSGFARDALMSWCERNRVEYVFGLARNARLEAELEDELPTVETLSRDSGQPARRFKDFWWATHDSWSRRRRVVAKMGWTAPDGVVVPLCGSWGPAEKEPPAMSIAMIGLDTAKSVFQVHAVDEAGTTEVRRKLRRSELIMFFEKQEACTVVMEACGAAHHWARVLIGLGHEVKLVAPEAIKPFVKKGKKNDAADAAAICQAACRPDIRFVPVKSLEQQGILAVHSARSLLVKQKTMLANAMRGLATEFGVTVPRGIGRLEELVVLADVGNALPGRARQVIRELLEHCRILAASIEVLEAEIVAHARQDEAARRLATIPGVGPITASLLAATVADIGLFKSARQFAAWLGLVPRQYSTGGKTRLGRITKAGNRELRKSLVLGATSMVYRAAAWNSAAGVWTRAILERRPVRLVTVALANKMARIAWALMTRKEIYHHKAPVTVEAQAVT